MIDRKTLVPLVILLVSLSILLAVVMCGNAEAQTFGHTFTRARLEDDGTFTLVVDPDVGSSIPNAATKCAVGIRNYKNTLSAEFEPLLPFWMSFDDVVGGNNGATWVNPSTVGNDSTIFTYTTTFVDNHIDAPGIPITYCFMAGGVTSDWFYATADYEFVAPTVPPVGATIEIYAPGGIHYCSDGQHGGQTLLVYFTGLEEFVMRYEYWDGGAWADVLHWSSGLSTAHSYQWTYFGQPFFDQAEFPVPTVSMPDLTDVRYYLMDRGLTEYGPYTLGTLDLTTCR